jgi:hypothetical protein
MDKKPDVIRLHNYHSLVYVRGQLLKQKEDFYKKYFTRDDNILEEMLTDDDAPKWYEMNDEINRLTVLIDRFDKGARG